MARLVSGFRCYFCDLLIDLQFRRPCWERHLRSETPIKNRILPGSKCDPKTASNMGTQNDSTIQKLTYIRDLDSKSETNADLVSAGSQFYCRVVKFLSLMAGSFREASAKNASFLALMHD